MKQFFAEDGFNQVMLIIAQIGLIFQIVFTPLDVLRVIWTITIILWFKLNHIEFLINQKMEDKSQL